MFDFTGKVVWVFLIAAFITTGTLSLTRSGDIAFNLLSATRIVWGAFVDLSEEGQHYGYPTNPDDGNALK